MALRWILLAAAALVTAACATANHAGTPIADWVGAYGHPQPPPLPPEPPTPPGEDDGPPRYWIGENVIEIRPLSPTQARIDIALFFPYGHQCGINGPADLINGKLVYREQAEHGLCEITVSREMNRQGVEELVIRETSDPKACMMQYCGMRGSFSAEIPVSTRHALSARPLQEFEE